MLFKLSHLVRQYTVLIFIRQLGKQSLNTNREAIKSIWVKVSIERRTQHHINSFNRPIPRLFFYSKFYNTTGVKTLSSLTLIHPCN